MGSGCQQRAQLKIYGLAPFLWGLSFPETRHSYPVEVFSLRLQHAQFGAALLSGGSGVINRY